MLINYLCGGRGDGGCRGYSSSCSRGHWNHMRLQVSSSDPGSTTGSSPACCLLANPRNSNLTPPITSWRNLGFLGRLLPLPGVSDLQKVISTLDALERRVLHQTDVPIQIDLMVISGNPFGVVRSEVLLNRRRFLLQPPLLAKFGFRH